VGPKMARDATLAPLQGCRCCLLSIAAGEGVCYGVQAPQPVLHREVEAEEFVDPLVLRYGRQALIKQKLKVVMVSANNKVTPPQVRAPVTDGLHEADENRRVV
jgi:hypothetical protein